MAKLLLATNNPGKLREYEALLVGMPLQLVSLQEQGITLEVEEGDSSFHQNATHKAIIYAAKSGLLTLADDSGLEVEVLGGEPGPRAKRYAGPQATDPQRIAYLLSCLEGVPLEKRTARFCCVIAIATPDGELELCEGFCEGIIALEPKGCNGFGYDPIFYLPQLGRTMAELSFEEKNLLSHRARAAEKARRILFRLAQEETLGRAS